MEEKFHSEWNTADFNVAQEAEPGVFQYNKHYESIFDDYRYFPQLKVEHDSVVKFDPNNEEVINHATLRALIVQLTSPAVIDYNLICDFFLTYRLFTDSHTVMSLLLTRLIWSLQYVNSFKEETEKIGKLVLLRTFVVLRHWILNYFIDDFKHDYDLCDSFSTVLNKITNCPSLIRSNMVFELKIFTDLKTHWLSQFNEFFDANIEFQSGQVYESALPMVLTVINHNKLTKSATEASIHTNPSFRRSAMLSLYDNKTHHKCLIFNDPASNDENPQLSVNNLLAQHKSSRLSLNDKLREFHTKIDKKTDDKAQNVSGKSMGHKKYMHFTDSSLALKKTIGARNSIQNEFKNDNIATTGFSTNGQVKLPTSRICQIVPPTPVKKMEYTIKDGHTPGKRKSTLHIGESTDTDGLGRKVSIKKFMEGWKKSFNTNELKTAMSPELSANVDFSVISSEEASDLIRNRVDTLSARIIDELEYLIRYSIVENTGTINETANTDRINLEEIPINSSLLSSKEGEVSPYENGAGNFGDGGSSPSLSDVRSEAPRPLSLQTGNKDIVSIQDVSELNIEKIDYIFSQDNITIADESVEHSVSKSNIAGIHPESDSQSGESSFRKVISINWNDEGNLDFENSHSLVQSPDESEIECIEGSGIIKSETKYFDVCSEKPSSSNPEKRLPPSNSSVSLPSDLDQYSAEIADLGIAMSPQSMKKLAHKINTGELFHANSASKRFSMFSGTSGGSLFNRDSVKSYLSYDSALSTSSNIKQDLPHDSNLRKKNGCQNLRKMANINLTDFNNLCDEQEQLYADTHNRKELPFKVTTTSMASRVSSSRKSVRFSTFFALTELPFNDFRESYIVLNNRETNHNCKLVGELSDSSAFSYANGERKSLPAIDSLSRESAASSVAIPGISSYALKELALIPDELKSKNPVKFTLHRLEGKGNTSMDTENNTTMDTTNGDASFGGVLGCENKAESFVREITGSEQKETENKKSAVLSNSSSDVAGFPDTEEILAEIHNADTKDVIDYSSDIEKELRERPVTPIKTRPRTALFPSASTPNMNAIILPVSAGENESPSSPVDPKVILEGYSLTSKHLSIEEVMKSGSHVSFVLSYSSKDLAEHFTIIETDMLQDIDWRELVELQWNKDLKPVNSWLEIIVNETYYSRNKGVNLVISRFNLMVNWIISEILLTTAEDERIMIISRFIHVAYHSLVLQNFSTLMQIILALSSEKITKLKLTWNRLHPGDILTFKNLEEMASPLKNFINIRVCTNLVQPSRGCIPFVGLYLSDLIFNAERPKYAKKSQTHLPMSPPPTAPSESADRALTLADSSTDSASSNMKSDRLINFSRFRTSVHIVKSLSQCIEWSKNYNLLVEDELLRKCLYIKSLDEEEMNYCLHFTETPH